MRRLKNRRRYELKMEEYYVRKAVALLAAVCLTLLAVGSAEDHREATRNQTYCDLYPIHTLCDQKSTRETCGYVKRRRLSREEALEVLHLHNLYRQNLTWGMVRGADGFLPMAANMRQMTYDMELHDIAQGAADRCVGGHDCGPCRTTRRGGVGQNVAEVSVLSDRGFSREKLNKIEVSPAKQMNGWLEEGDHMRFDHVTRCCDAPTGHYTQMVWADSHVLGCGWIEHEVSRGLTARLYCNYGPAGNYRDQAVYKIGEPCSACPRGTSCSTVYRGLCI